MTWPRYEVNKGSRRQVQTKVTWHYNVTQKSDQGHTDIEVHDTSAGFLYPEYSATPVCSVLRTVTPEHFDSLGGGTSTTQVQKYKTYNNVHYINCTVFLAFHQSTWTQLVVGLGSLSRVDRCSSVFSQTDFFHFWTHIMPSKYHMWLCSIQKTTHRGKNIINIFSYSKNISLKNQYDMTFEVIWVFFTWFILFSNCKSRGQAYKNP